MQAAQNIKAFYEKYHHATPTVIFMAIYLIWWGWLERNILSDYNVIHMGIDDYIPFCEYFIIPYMLWFPYVVGFVFYFFRKDTDDYYRLITFLFVGMTVFLVVSTLWPNGHHLRMIGAFPRDNACANIVRWLWRTDTPTNLWPSIHVYNSLGVYFAVLNSERLKHRLPVRIASFTLTAAIIASTVLIKQHSMFDVITAFILAAVVYAIVYMYDVVFVVHTAGRIREQSVGAIRTR